VIPHQIAIVVAYLLQFRMYSMYSSLHDNVDFLPE
jgi:hypothetical protein